MSGMQSWGSAGSLPLLGNYGSNDFSSLANWGGPATSMAIEGLNPLASVAQQAPMSNWGAISNWMDNSGMLGKKLADGTQVQGWGGLGLGAASGIMNAWMGMQQYGLAKDQLAQSKKAFDMNYNAQVKTTNAALEDRQNARVASNPGAYQSTGDYMKKNGLGV